MSEAYIKRSENFIFRKVVNEMILVPIKQDVANMEHIFTLNEVGAFIWDQLSQPCSEEMLRSAILEAFDVDPATVLQDLHSFLQALDEISAVERSV